MGRCTGQYMQGASEKPLGSRGFNIMYFRYHLAFTLMVRNPTGLVNINEERKLFLERNKGFSKNRF